MGIAAQNEVERFETKQEEARTARVEQLVSRFYSDRREWSQLQPLLEQAGRIAGRRIIVTDQNGDVVGDSHRVLGGPRDRLRNANGPQVTATQAGNPPRHPLPVYVDNRQVGTFSMLLDVQPEGIVEPAATSVVSAVNKSLIGTGVAAAALGTLLVLILSRRTLAPVQSLGTAAIRLGRGDLSQRAPSAGPTEIKQLANSFNAMAADLEEAERRRRNLVADVAHELRTPVSNIQGYLEAIKDGLLEPGADTVDTIYGQVLHLSRLVEDLRLLAQVEAGALQLHRTPGPLPELLQHCLDAVRPRAESKGVSVSLETDPATPLVEMDGTRIAQVVGNLLENAIIHTPEGGSISISARPQNGDQVQVTVTDTGTGIAADDLPRLFDRFYRADPSRSRSTGGVGLGLTIAKQLVEAHGGSIEVESGPEAGTRFAFRLPVESTGTGGNKE